MRKPIEHTVEMIFATKDRYPGPRRGEAIQRDADAAIAKQNLPHPVKCVGISWSWNDPAAGWPKRFVVPDVLQVIVRYHEVTE